MHVILMPARTGLEDEHKLVLGTIEAAHPGIGLRPDAKVEHDEARRARRDEQLGRVPPIHADIMDGAGAAEGSHVAHRRFEKFREGDGIHLAGRRREFAMAGLSKAADVAIDRHVIGRIARQRPPLLRPE